MVQPTIELPRTAPTSISPGLPNMEENKEGCIATPLAWCQEHGQFTQTILSEIQPIPTAPPCTHGWPTWKPGQVSGSQQSQAQIDQAHAIRGPKVGFPISWGCLASTRDIHESHGIERDSLPSLLSMWSFCWANCRYEQVPLIACDLARESDVLSTAAIFSNTLLRGQLSSSKIQLIPA